MINKNILLLSNIYPMPDKNYTGTKVAHYYTTEWAKMGYNVRVVHFMSLFPRIYYWAAKYLAQFIRAKKGFVVYTKLSRTYQRYELDGIPIMMMPLSKRKPHSRFKQSVVDKALKIIYQELKEEGFVPDIITAHFELPQLQFLNEMKKEYHDATTCLVMHSGGGTIPKIYPDYKKLFKSVDIWGFRSEAFKKAFELSYGEQDNSFICYSGIPEKYIDKDLSRDFSSGVFHFSFLGSLFKLKRVEDTIKALNNVYADTNFRFDIVGEGAERKNIESLIKELNLSDKIKLHGQLERDKAQTMIANSQCFVMVSSREAFGLVYVEAMAKGCIVIGTKGQGIDGVVKHGENGFLCESGNIEELSKLIEQIKELPNDELQRISNNAIRTASNLSNRKVAEHYIQSIEKLRSL